VVYDFDFGDSLPETLPASEPEQRSIRVFPPARFQVTAVDGKTVRSLPDPPPKNWSKLSANPQLKNGLQLKRRRHMSRKRHPIDQIITKLREAEVRIARGETIAQACKAIEVTEQTYYRWRKQYGGLKSDQAKRLKELEKENGRLR